MATRGRPKKKKPEMVKATKGRPACPMCLGKEGRKEWKRVIPELDSMGILAQVDRATLTTYCEAWEDFVNLLEEYKVDGATVTTDKGNIVQNPILGAKNKAAERLLKIARQFGMTPAARTKLEAAEAGDEDAFAKFVGLKVV